MQSLRLIPTAVRYVESFNAAVGIVARERRYLALLDAPSVESTREFVQRVVDGGGAQTLAVTPDDTVVGWCDVVRIPFEGFRHVGRLGMGVLPECRGRGLGRQLAVETMYAARLAGITRIELEVFGSNRAAIGLYARLGFVTEGIKRHARHLDGAYDDTVVMAWLEEDAPTPGSVLPTSAS
jgi:ribosomal protein S18 acetylase RimI-like enzyme